MGEKKNRKKACIITAVSAAAVLAAAGIALTAAHAGIDSGTVCKNVYVESINAGGMTYDELLQTIQATYLLKDQEISLVCQGQSYTINGASVGIGADAEETAKKAFEYAKSGSYIMDALSALRLKVYPVNIIPAAYVDTDRLDEELNNFGKRIYGELNEPSVVVQADGYVWVDPGKSGYNNDPSVARGEVLWHIQYESFENIPVTLESGDPRRLEIDEFDASVYRDMQNAYYIIEDNEVTVADDLDGRYIDKEQAKKILDALNPGDDPALIPYTSIPAEVTSEELTEKLFSSKLGTFSTSYSSSTSGRKKNVALAAEKINGTVIAAGETFSFNDVVGARTIANGFSKAPEYSNGETVEGVGGGTCQVSTTLFNSVLLADLQIVSRSAHSKPVHYVARGRDATVSTGGPDFKFKNNTDYPIKITASANGSTLAISIYGAPYDVERNVKLSVSESNETYTLSRTVTDENGEVIHKEVICSSRYSTSESE